MTPRLLAWAGLALCALFFLTTGGTYPGIASVDAHVIGQILAYVVLGGWCVLALVRPAWRPSTPLLLPIGLAAAAYAASAVISQRPRLSFEPTIAGLGWALAYLFVARLVSSQWFRARVAVLLTAFVAVVAFGYIAQVLVEWWSWWGLVGRFAIPPLRPSFVALWLGSPNLIGTALILLAPLVVAIAWVRPRARWLGAVLAVVSAAAIFISGSRGAWLGVGAGSVVAVALLVARVGGPRAAAAILAAQARSRPILALPVVLVAVLALAFAPSVLARLNQGGATLRFDLWRSAISIFADHPVLGAGPGTWVQLKVGANPPGVPNLILPHAHDMYVQAAAEVGIVGLVALGILAIAVGRRLWSGWRSTDRALSLQAGAVIVSLAAWATQSVVDNLVNLPFVVLLLVAVVAWVDSGQPKGEPETTTRRGTWITRLSRGPAIPALALVGFVVLLPVLLRIDGAAGRARAGNVAALDGDWPAALTAYDVARTSDPGFTMYEMQVAGALARVGRTAEARDVLAHAVESDQTAVNLIGLAALETQLGDLDRAIEHVKLARQLGIGEPVVALNAGLLAEDLGEEDIALDAFADAIAWDPPLAGATIWEESLRVGSKGMIIGAARDKVGPLDKALILAYAGDPIGARVDLDNQPQSGQRDVYIAACTWLNGDAAGALDALDTILRADPNNWYAAAWASRVARLSGNASAAGRYEAQARADQADQADSVSAELSNVSGDDVSPIESLPFNYPWAVYLRPISPYPLMPTVASITSR